MSTPGHQKGIGQLIVNSPYEEPARHWRYHRETRTFTLESGRRPAGYVVASERSRSFDDPGVFVEIPLVNTIRPRVNAWREAGYPGVTGITKRLLEHWRSPEEFDQRRFFFCQLESIETLIWLSEAPAAERTGILVPGDGGPFLRLCAKMATGSGKTIVMAMAIAWHILNKVTNGQDPRFSKNVMVIAPGLTVKKRLQVLYPTGASNYYEQFNIVPGPLREKLRLGNVIVHNWHTLNWESDDRVAKKRTVDKRGAKSDEAYTRDVLGKMGNASKILVINDEAHHAWRIPAETKVKGVTKDQLDEATKWVGGLDRINKTRGLLACYDFSATPFAPSGKQSNEEALFDWIVSDFGLNDAIEAGLVKTPRVVIRDDALPNARDYKSRMYHIYDDPEVKDDLNGKHEAHVPLPDLVVNAYHLLAYDWRESAKRWAGQPTPPVMISVANRTETAARIKFTFDRKRIPIEELCDPARTLHIDSKVLELAEAKMDSSDETENTITDDGEDEAPTRKLTKAQIAEQLRQQVDTVGQPGKPGAAIQNVISVGMLSEGWDAKTVTHIMGLRAFSSQLLCEQVVGRGLRRTSYDVNPSTGLFEPEYVNIFGVPFTFLPHEGGEDLPPEPPAPKTRIEPDPAKARYAIQWPNVLRIDHVYREILTLEWDKVDTLVLDAGRTATLAQLASVVDGKPNVASVSEIDLEKLARDNRLQKIVFETARDVYDQIQPNWKGNREYLLAQVVRLVEQFLARGRIQIDPPLFNLDPLRRQLMLALNMTKIVQHIWDAIRPQNSESVELVFDPDHPIRSTGDMATWYTGKPCEPTEHSHINFCVYDGTWEASESFVLDRAENIDAWAKNDHLGFEILYIYRGVVRKYRPDFLVRLKNGDQVVLEVKGEDTEQDRVKHRYLTEWISAINEDGGFGKWRAAIAKSPAEIKGVLGL